MTEDVANVSSHTDIEQELTEEIEWPQYFVTMEDGDIEGFAPLYYRIRGPNGPVSSCTPGSGPSPATMYDLLMGAKYQSFRQVERNDTPWGEDND